METAWSQITAHGAAALSLRAIARELGITAPAIYNYFPDRDALVTALIIDAYQSLGDSQLAARDAVPQQDPAARLRAVGRAYRAWALEHPQHYQLIFGTPIPGYEAPMAETLPAAARSLSALVSVIEELRVAGKLNTDTFPEVSQEGKSDFETWKTYGGEVDRLSLAVAILVWTRVHGLVSLEISGNMPPFGAKGDELYQFELDATIHNFVRA
jgi:AcrR family transcriptional regulator